MKGRRAAAVIVVTSLVWIALAGDAAAGSIERNGWFSVGVGGGATRGGRENLLFDRTSLVMSGCFARGRDAVSVRYAQVGFGESDGDVAILYGRTLVDRQVELRVSAGPGILYRHYGVISDGPDDEMFDRAGLAWSIEAISHTRTSLAIGVTGFGEIAGSRGFGGLAILLQVGG